MRSTNADASPPASLPLWGALFLCVVGAVGVTLAMATAAGVRAAVHGGLVSESFAVVARDPVTFGCAQLVGAALLLFFGLRIFARETPIRDALGLEPVPVTVVALAAVAGFALQFPLAELGNLLREIFPVPIEEELARRVMFDPVDPIARLGVVVSAVAMAPLSEELVFRGLFLRLLDARYGRAVAIALTAFLFGAAHGGHAFAYAAIAGVYLALVAYATGSTLAALIVHAASNAVPVVLSSRVVTIRGFNTIGQVHHLPWWVVGITSLVAAAALFSMWRAGSKDDR